MKCPKCHYLGFETGDRCKNCGYDFSLIGSPTAARTPEAEPASGPTVVGPYTNLSEQALSPAGDRLSLADTVIDRLADLPLRDARIEDHESGRGSQARRSLADTLPLFTGTSLDDEPLVR